MRKVTHSLIAAAIAASATPAMANDNADNFTGPRAEALVGFDLLDVPLPNNLEGVSTAINAGYDFNAGGVVLGIEGEAGFTFASTAVGATTDLEGSRSLYAGVRAGVPVSENTLIYAKAGYANTRIRLEDTVTGNTLTAVNLDGVRGGIGAEHKINDAMHIKGEYRYSNYETGIEGHQAMVGLGIRF